MLQPTGGFGGKAANREGGPGRSLPAPAAGQQPTGGSGPGCSLPARVPPCGGAGGAIVASNESPIWGGDAKGGPPSPLALVAAPAALLAGQLRRFKQFCMGGWVGQNCASMPSELVLRAAAYRRLKSFGAQPPPLLEALFFRERTLLSGPQKSCFSSGELLRPAKQRFGGRACDFYGLRRIMSGGGRGLRSIASGSVVVTGQPGGSLLSSLAEVFWTIIRCRRSY